LECGGIEKMHLGIIIDYTIVEKRTYTFSKVFVAFKLCIDQVLRRIPCPAINNLLEWQVLGVNY